MANKIIFRLKADQLRVDITRVIVETGIGEYVHIHMLPVMNKNGELRPIDKIIVLSPDGSGKKYSA